MLSLPPELINEVIDYGTTQEILALRCVNKTLCTLLTPAAFREIAVHSTEKSAQGFLDLLVSADIAKCVRVLRIIEDSISAVPYEFQKEEEERVKRVCNHLRSACFMLHLMPALESFVFTSQFLRSDSRPTYYYELSRFHLLQSDVLEGLACNPNLLPALQSLQIDNWLARPYHAAPFKRTVSSLRDLRILVQETNRTGDIFSVRDGWADVIVQPAVNLTSLALESGVELGSLLCHDLSSVTFPCLTSLSLSKFYWNDGTCWTSTFSSYPRKISLMTEDFIVRHGKSLKKLELLSCMKGIPLDRHTPVRSWAATWNQFADELTELVDLVVEYFRHDVRYGAFLRPIYGVEQDTPALEALLTIVKERKRATSELELRR